MEKKDYNVEYKLSEKLFDDEVEKIQEFVKKSMDKIFSFSNYNLLKVTMKTLGNTVGTHKMKYSVNLVLSEGNKILHVDREIISGTSDEIKNNKVKGDWNIPLLVQEALVILEKKVIDEKEINK